MHEEWLDTRRSAETEVQLTGAPLLLVTKETPYAGLIEIRYRPYRVQVYNSWPGNKIGNAGQPIVHIYANEVYLNDVTSPLKTTLLPADLDEVPQWLVDLVRAAQARNFG